MKSQEEKSLISTEKEVVVKMIVDAWEAQNAKADKLLAELSDEQLQSKTAPNKNSGVYLFGHLIAVNDGLLQILGFGEKLQPQLEEIFLTNPDDSGFNKPSITELKQFWKEINAAIREHIQKTTAEEWFAKHTSVSAEDFAKEPHRNKLNVLISRTNHQSYHLGQLSLLAAK